MKLFYFFATFLLPPTFGQQQLQFMQNCDEAPTEEARRACIMLHQMARNSRTTNQVVPPVPPQFLQPAPLNPYARGQIASHPYDCMTITCLCPFFQGSIGPQNQCILRNGQLLTMAYRKEYRMLTEEERLRFLNAITMLKRSGEYDRMSIEHQEVGQGSGAHSGPGFLPWHREFVKRFEIALRLIDPEVTLPYWDCVMDNYLPDPRDSIFFSTIFMGETDFFGNVITGPFAYWSTIDGRNAIVRALGEKGKLFTEFDLADILSQTSIEQIMAYTAPLDGCPFPPAFTALEYTHSFVHLWIGGHMEPPEQSSNDPIFYGLHAFVDLIWEVWRQNRQSPWARENIYSQDIEQCADPQHFSYATMRPFNLINRDGLSNLYTDQMYRYAPRPGCSTEIPTCGSPYLFCDLRGAPHCVSKIKLGGVCTGFEGLDACFNGICVAGRCIPGATPAPFEPETRLPGRIRGEIFRLHAARQFNDCFNKIPCCEQWAKEGDCQTDKLHMAKFCAAACGNCRPSYNASNECSDRHVSCKQWEKEEQCFGNSSDFMAENCRTSCQLCGKPKNMICEKRKKPLKKQAKQTSNKTKKMRLSNTNRNQIIDGNSTFAV
uniref:ShKT domain-containing protein n=1 Tax=Onchocerca volvulus TaxID=6282 RepID=A0A8R1TXN9_ONCVO